MKITPQIRLKEQLAEYIHVYYTIVSRGNIYVTIRKNIARNIVVLI